MDKQKFTIVWSLPFLLFIFAFSFLGAWCFLKAPEKSDAVFISSAVFVHTAYADIPADIPGGDSGGGASTADGSTCGTAGAAAAGASAAAGATCSDSGGGGSGGSGK